MEDYELKILLDRLEEKQNQIDWLTRFIIDKKLKPEFDEFVGQSSRN